MNGTPWSSLPIYWPSHPTVTLRKGRNSMEISNMFRIGALKGPRVSDPFPVLLMSNVWVFFFLITFVSKNHFLTLQGLITQGHWWLCQFHILVIRDMFISPIGFVKRSVLFLHNFVLNWFKTKKSFTISMKHFISEIILLLDASSTYILFCHVSTVVTSTLFNSQPSTYYRHRPIVDVTVEGKFCL